MCFIDLDISIVFVPPSLTVRFGMLVKFICYSDEKLKWIYNNSVLLNTNSSGWVPDKYLNWLVLENVLPSQSGEYQCFYDEFHYRHMGKGYLIVEGKLT